MGRDAVGDDAGLRAKSVALRRNDVYVCVYIYICIYTCISIYMCVYIQIHKHTHACMHADRQTDRQTDRRTYTYIYIYTRRCIYNIYTQMHLLNFRNRCRGRVLRPDLGACRAL